MTSFPTPDEILEEIVSYRRVGGCGPGRLADAVAVYWVARDVQDRAQACKAEPEPSRVLLTDEIVERAAQAALGDWWDSALASELSGARADAHAALLSTGLFTDGGRT